MGTRDGRFFSCSHLSKEKPTSELVLAGRNELDLLNQSAVEDFIKLQKPDIVINAAAKVGGIHANDTYPAEFIHQNLLINTNLIHAAWQNGVGRFLNLGVPAYTRGHVVNQSRRSIC